MTREEPMKPGELITVFDNPSPEPDTFYDADGNEIDPPKRKGTKLPEELNERGQWTLPKEETDGQDA